MPDTGSQSKEGRHSKRAGEHGIDYRTSFVEHLVVVVAILVVALLIWQWRHALLLVMASVVVACGLKGIGDPIRSFTSIGEKASVGVAVLAVVGALTALIVFFGSQVFAQADQLAKTLPGAVENLQAEVASTEIGRIVADQVQSQAVGGDAFAGLIGGVSAFGLSFASAGLEAFLVVVAGVFLALDPVAYREGIVKLTPRAIGDDVRYALNHSGRMLKKWLLGTLFSMAAMTFMVTLGLWSLGAPAPLALGLLSGVAQFIPFIGPIFAAVPGILLAFAIDPSTAALAALVYFAASTIEANVLYPLIQKKAVNQPPVVTLFAVIAFGLLFGALGALLAVPITLVATVFIILFYVRGALGRDVALPGG
jgi:predicted PurR-regulated permease PerM